MIIAISGQAGSGKDTAADFLVKHRGFVKVAFADPMKRICKEVYDFTDEQLWGPSELRNVPDERYPRVFAATMNDGPNNTFPTEYLTPRYALQQLGTEWGRSCYLQTWTRLLLKTAKTLMDGQGEWGYYGPKGLYRWSDTRDWDEADRRYNRRPRGIVVPDLRWPDGNEGQAIRAAGGRLLRMKRGTGLKGEAGEHLSEASMQDVPDVHFDEVVENEEWSLLELENFMCFIVPEWTPEEGEAALE